MAIKVSVIGATGRMGVLAHELIQATQDLELHSALDSKSSLDEAIGADVLFDVTRLDVSENVVDFAIKHELNIVVGTSGWKASKLAEIEKKLEGKKSSVVVVPNFSIGSMLGTKFAAEAAKYYQTVEIVEAHHETKIDSPSGTAVRTAEVIAQNREAGLIQGVGQEARGQVVAGIPVHSLRLAGISARQEVHLSDSSEMLTITHEVWNMRSYEAGMLASFRFASKSSGLTVGLQAVLEN